MAAVVVVRLPLLPRSIALFSFQFSWRKYSLGDPKCRSLLARSSYVTLRLILRGH